ncbi:MAG: hypothetical protein AAB914_04720 [Patescibacteria group bacterium]
MKSLFGTDGFRGEFTEKSGSALLNTETLYGLSQALIQYANTYKILVVGRDTRPSSNVLAEAVIKAGVDAGVEVWDLGVMPTPATFKVAQHFKTLAIMITASHNPHTDNGWKAAIAGDKLTNEEAGQVSDLYYENLDRDQEEVSVGQIIDKSELSNWYITQVISSIESEFSKQPLAGKILVIDGANGATMNYTPEILEALGAEIHRFACDGSGKINENCGAANLEGIKGFLKERPEIVANPNFLGAIANDGDGDRMMGIGARTDLAPEWAEITGNHVLYALAQGQKGIVGTLYTNSGLVESLKDQDIGFDQCKNGDTAVTAGLVARQTKGDNWTRGGEFTGHHVDTDWLSSGDGVRMAGWFASYVARAGKNFADVYNELPLWPETKTAVRIDPNAPKIEENDQIKQEIESIKAELGDQGRIVVRTSGTEPVVRIWGEAKPASANIKNIVTDLSKFIQANS